MKPSVVVVRASDYRATGPESGKGLERFMQPFIQSVSMKTKACLGTKDC